MNAAVQSNVDSGAFTNFSIDMTKAAFRVLSDTLYSNKIGSVVREICRNGADSHDMAGIPNEPIDVTLPTRMNPHFIVKDHGLGLNEQQVNDILRHYFRSTKDNSFGLGFKSFFAYTDSAIITTIKDGVKLFFTATMDENGFPFIVKMGEEKTTEHNGVEVSIPVKDYDFYKFEHEVFNQCKYFDTFPNVKGSDKTFTDWKASIWKQVGPIGFHNVSTIRNCGSVTIIVKKVGYDININNDLDQHFTKAEKEFIKVLKGSYWFMPDIETTPSREDISFSVQTINAIKKLLRDNHAMVKDMMVKEFNDISGTLDKFVWLAQHSTIASAFNLTLADTDNFKFHLTGNCIEPNEKYKNILTAISYNADYNGRVSRDTIRDNLIMLSADKYKVVIGDGSKQPVSKIRYWLKELRQGGDPQKVLYYKVEDSKKFFKDLDCKNPEKYFTMLSDMEAPPKTDRTYNRQKVEAWKIFSQWFHSRSGCDRIYDEIDSLKGYYVLVEDMQTSHTVSARAWAFHSYMGGNENVYAIRNKDADKIVDNEELLPFEDTMHKLIKEKITSTMIVKANLFGNNYSDFEELCKRVPMNFCDPDIVLLSKLIDQREKQTSDEVAIYEFIRRNIHQNYMAVNNKIFKKINKFLNKLKARYPLALNRYYYGDGGDDDKLLKEVLFYMETKAKLLASQGKL